MSEVVRLYQYKSLLSGRRAVSAQSLQQALEISPATFKRDIAKLRDQLHVPIEFNREFGGYTLEQGHTDTELPGLSLEPSKPGSSCSSSCWIERELLGDLLRFGADVEVLAPPDLRGRIKRALHEAPRRYV